MNILGIHFHSWQSVNEESKYDFEGGICTRYIQRYRKCKECNIIQSYTYDSQGGFWFKLSPCEAKLVQKRINSNYFICGE